MITILCAGSRGDIQPYIALAQQIQKLGQAVRIAAGKSYGEFVKEYGIEFYPLSADQNTVEIDPGLLDAAANATNPLKMLSAFSKMKKYARLMVDEMYEACIGSDIVVYHPGCTIGYFAANQLGIPSVMASPFPMLRTKETASVIAYGKSKMPEGISYTLLQNMLWMASKTGIKSFWKEKFGKKPEDFGIPYEKVDERHPSVVSCSEYVFRRPKDWNKNVHQYGYWFADQTEEYQGPEELMDFLNSGEKPIYFGFGSVYSGKDKLFFVTAIKEALKGSHHRAILCGMGKVENLPENMISIDAAPHSWLFKQCSAVCHHGGAGTTAAGFAAGVPSIIIPFSNDQFAWAHRSYDLGVGAKPIYKKDFSAQKLKEAIDYALSGKVICQAKILGENISKENGAAKCAEVIVHLL